MKKLLFYITIAQWSVPALLAMACLWKYLHYKANLALYGTMSAPWYTALWIYAIVAALAMLCLSLARWGVKRRLTEPEEPGLPEG